MSSTTTTTISMITRPRRICCKLCRRELANQHDVVHGKAGSTHSLSDFAPKPDSASTASAASAASVPVTQTLTLSGSDSRVQIQLSQAAPLPQPPRSILHNPACSGYFIETTAWMQPFLQQGEIAGKISCPNPKCNAKVGNYDWTGVPCGCGEWVTPGFCIHRSKVDEIAS